MSGLGSPDVPRRGFASGLPASRQAWGFATAIVGIPTLTVALLPFRGNFGLDTVLLAYLLVAVTASAIGGVLPALLATAAAAMCANFFFAEPYHSLVVRSQTEGVDLVVFTAVAALVTLITELAARSAATAERSKVEARWLRELGSREHGHGSLSEALADARSVFGMNAAALRDGGTTLAGVGSPAPDDIEVVVDAGQGLTLVLSGPASVGQDRKLLGSLATTAGRLWRTEQLAAQARRAEELAKVDQVRSALLAAVGHDLRSPLAAIKASVATLRQDDIELEDAERAELLAAVEERTDRLGDLIANLLDMSRIQAGALVVQPRTIRLEEALVGAFRPGEAPTRWDIPEDLPMIRADAGLLERVLANLIDNARRHVTGGPGVEVIAQASGTRVLVQVIDHGPGIPAARLDAIFTPFQRFDDRSHAGVGLGLAIAKGFTEAMGGRIVASTTPGGGLTMTLDLEAADAPVAHR